VAYVIDLDDVRRDAVGFVLAARRGDVDGMSVLGPSADPIRAAALAGSLAGLVWRLADALGQELGTDGGRVLERIALAMGGGADGLA
jgi:hypothetical protein